MAGSLIQPGPGPGRVIEAQVGCGCSLASAVGCGGEPTEAVADLGLPGLDAQRRTDPTGTQVDGQPDQGIAAQIQIAVVALQPPQQRRRPCPAAHRRPESRFPAAENGAWASSSMSPYGESATSPWPIVVIRRLIGRAVRRKSSAWSANSRDTGQASQGKLGPAEAQHQQRHGEERQPHENTQARQQARDQRRPLPTAAVAGHWSCDPLTLQLTARDFPSA